MLRALVRTIRCEARPRRWQCHLTAIGPDGTQRVMRFPAPVLACTSAEAARTAVAIATAGRDLDGWSVRCRATLW